MNKESTEVDRVQQEIVQTWDAAKSVGENLKQLGVEIDQIIVALSTLCASLPETPTRRTLTDSPLTMMVDDGTTIAPRTSRRR